MESLDLDANAVGRRKRFADASVAAGALPRSATPELRLLPEQHDCDTWLDLRSQPLALRYDDDTYGRLAYFFALPGGRALQSEAARQLQERSAGLAAAASRRRVGCGTLRSQTTVITFRSNPSHTFTRSPHTTIYF